MNVDVVGVGASCVDQVCRLPVFPEAGGPLAKVRMQDQTRGMFSAFPFPHFGNAPQPGDDDKKR